MGRTSTLIRITFFSFLLAGFAVVQYSWIRSIQKDKLQKFRMRVLSGVEEAGRNMPPPGSLPLYALTNADIAHQLRQSFSTKGLSNIRFEYSLGSGNHRLATHGYDKSAANNAHNLIFCYVFQQNGAPMPDNLLAVVIPFWEKMALRGMGWTIAAAICLTLMVVAIFYYVFLLGERKQQIFYDNRTNAIKNMMQQFETPLSTVSVAAEALRNNRVMQDSAQLSYYQQIINEENHRMDEQVKKFMRDVQ